MAKKKIIQEGINESEILAIVVSSNSIASEWVEKEFIFASKRGLKVVPLLYEHCEIPIWLLNLQYIDLIGVNYNLNFNQVLESFEKYGRRASDAKVVQPKMVRRISRISPYWLLLFVIILLLILVGVLIRPFPIAPIFPSETSTNTVTIIPSKTDSPTNTVTNTSVPPTKTSTATLKATDLVDEETATASPTLTFTPTSIASPTPSATPTFDGLAPAKTDDSGAEMILVPSSSFLMGKDAGNADENPVHLVKLDDYYIDKYEVSNADYKACVEDLKCSLPKTTTFYASILYRNHPIVFLSWDKAKDFCEWRDARLPTEAEWEKAARGTDTLNYPWGNIFDKRATNFCDAECENAWADQGVIDKYTMTAPIGTYPDGQSPYDIYDMAGNVSEWVADWYGEEYYQDSPIKNPLGPENGTYRVFRGGSWYDKKTDLYTFSRFFLRPEIAYNYIGFRCAGDVE